MEMVEVKEEIVEVKEEIVEGVELKLEDLHHSIDVKEETSELEGKSEAVLESKHNLGVNNSKCTPNSLLIKPEVVQIRSQMFACSVCEKTFAHKCSLKIHLTSHTGDKPYACLICNYRSARRDFLNDHVKVHTGEKPYSCKLCTYKGSTRQNVNQHMVTHISEKKFVCTVCGYKTATKERMKNHNRIHTGEKPFACVICGYKFSSKQHMTEHVRTHSNEKPFVCNTCGFSCKLKDYLRRHIRSHTREKPSARKLYRRNLEEYIKPAAKPLPGVIKYSPLPGVIKCSLKQNLKQYTIPEKRFACKICGYKFMLQSTLTNHLGIHNDKLPFNCQTSSSECAQTKSLPKQNLKQYTIPEKRFACKICGYKCMLQSTLTDHLRTHNDKSPFTCQMSDSECAQTSQRKCLLSSPSCDQHPRVKSPDIHVERKTLTTYRLVLE